MTESPVMDDGGGKHFALHIAEVVYDGQAAFDWKVCQPSFDLADNWLQRVLMTGGPGEAVRFSQLESTWRQIAWSYGALEVNAATAMSFLPLVDSYPEDSAEHLGMKSRFQREFECFLFRLFALRERIYHLSNIYHRSQFKRRDLRGGYWKALKDSRAQDDFISLVDQFLETPAVGRFLRLRHDMTHNFELALVGIGWAPLCPRYDSEGKINGIGLGATYEGAVDLNEVVAELRLVFEAITVMLEGLDLVLRAEFAA